ncbi:hypothetical protein J6590_072600 [Homalodisca vitripennis]|nr:hypothetical protein J6590_072600 [Homalodisca vitripennis]
MSYRVPSFNSRSNLLFAVPFCRTTAHTSSPLYRLEFCLYPYTQSGLQALGSFTIGFLVQRTRLPQSKY